MNNTDKPSPAPKPEEEERQGDRLQSKEPVYFAGKAPSPKDSKMRFQRLCRGSTQPARGRKYARAEEET